MSDPVVEVTEGKLKGLVSETPNNVKYFAFKGIPFAKPPIGELRFAIPEAPEPWEGVRDATKSGNICSQYDKVSKSVIGDEDCLYLNVYTPKLLTEKTTPLPVMVYLHGGGFVSGSGTDDTIHGPDYLIEKDIILVGLNYRLGILGFLSLDRKEAPGNMGLRDQIQALKWIQQNIKSFGGDPNNVTLFGISAGGASVEYILIAPMAKGLFHKAIIQSGSSLNPWTFKDNIKELAFKIPILKGRKIVDDEELYQYLKTMPLTHLISTAMIALSTDVHYAHKCSLYFGFVPTLEKPGDWEPVFSKEAYSLLTQGEFTKVPTIRGFCSNEGLLIQHYQPESVQQLVKEKKMAKWLPFDIDDVDKGEVESKLKAVYLDGNGVSQEPDDFAIDYLGDVEFFGGIYTAAKLMSKNNPSLYFYEFSYDGGLNYLKKKLNIERSGTCHGDDGGYLIKSNILSEDVSDTDKLIRERMVHMWTSFAKTGNPTPTINDVITTKWESVAETGFNYLRIDDKLTMNEKFDHAKGKLFEDLYTKYYSPQ